MDKQKAACDIIAATLPLVPFEGWSMHALFQGAENASYKKGDVIRVFPGGAMDAVMHYHLQADAQLEEDLKQYHLDTMKIRARITLAVRLRLESHVKEKEAIRRALTLHMLPFNMPQATRALYHTVDTIWHAIGDTSTDFNFYTKRATLAAVYSATLLFWLNDESAGHEDTWSFLDRRIENVMQFEKFKHKVKSFKL